MAIVIELENNEQIITANLNGNGTAKEGISEFPKIVRFCKDHNKNKLLVNIINTKLSLDTMGVFQAAVNMEIFRDNHIKVALLSLIELKDESHFAETVAQNRGTNFRTFTDLDTAINWLLNN